MKNILWKALLCLTCCLSFGSTNGQTLENLEWFACNIYEDSTFMLWTGDSVYFRVPAIPAFEQFVPLATYTLSEDTMFWTDLESADQCDPAELGIYLYEIDANELTFSLVSDPCYFREDVLDNIILKAAIFLSNDELAETEFSIFPNPVPNDYLNISFDPGGGAFQFELIDIMGRKLRSGALNGFDQLNLSGIPPGHYFLNIIEVERQATRVFSIFKS